jgi:hypothetical protein
MKFIDGHSKGDSLPEHTTSIKILWRGRGKKMFHLPSVPEQTGLALG